LTCQNLAGVCQNLALPKSGNGLPKSGLSNSGTTRPLPNSGRGWDYIPPQLYANMGLFEWLKALFRGKKKAKQSRTVVVQVKKEEEKEEPIIPEVYLAELLGKSQKDKEFYQALFSQLFQMGWADPSVAPVPQRSKYRWLKRLYALKIIEKTPSGHVVFSHDFEGILDLIKAGVEDSRKALEKGRPPKGA